MTLERPQTQKLFTLKKGILKVQKVSNSFWYGNNTTMLYPGLDTPSIGITAIKGFICICAGNDRMLSYSGHIIQELCQDRGATDFQILEPISLHHSCKTNNLNNNQHSNLCTGAVCKKLRFWVVSLKQWFLMHEQDVCACELIVCPQTFKFLIKWN